MVGQPLDISVDWAGARFIVGADLLTLEQADPDIGADMRACDTTPADASCIVSRILYKKWSGIPVPGERRNTPLCLENAPDGEHTSQITRQAVTSGALQSCPLH